jgi:hypothetical protein
MWTESFREWLAIGTLEKKAEKPGKTGRGSGWGNVRPVPLTVSAFINSEGRDVYATLARAKFLRRRHAVHAEVLRRDVRGSDR